MTGWRGGLPSNQPAEAPAGPCGPARAAVDERCAEADRLLQASEAHQHDLREARRQLDDLMRVHDGDARVRDRRLLAEQKANAQRAYDRAIDTATDEAGLRDAAALWLREIHELNRRARLADLRADGLAHELTELERRLPGLELATDTARIAAESAHAACTDARRALAACEEEVHRGMTAGRPAPVVPAPAPPPVPLAPTGSPQMSPWGNVGQSIGHSSGSVAAQPVPSGSPAAPPWSTPPPDPAAPEPQPRMRLGEGARGVLRGDRQQMLALALRLAEETGIEAGRLQLLLLELRASIATRALESYALRFPPDHPFWGQFPEEAAICVATSLGSMGYRYDGLTGWADGRSPGIRELALALSHCGFDHRSLRRPASQAAIDGLWEGTSVLFEEYLMREAPDLSLPDLVTTLGPHADRLGELWDIWGRLRPMLVEPA